MSKDLEKAKMSKVILSQAPGQRLDHVLSLSLFSVSILVNLDMTNI